MDDNPVLVVWICTPSSREADKRVTDWSPAWTTKQAAVNEEKEAMVVYAFRHSALKAVQTDLCAFKASVVYIPS